MSKPLPESSTNRQWRVLRCSAVVGSLLSVLAACAVDVQNTQPARALARSAEPPGSVYAGWRIFQGRCARCHGSDATGGAGPNLLPRVGEMGARRFVNLVLYRYDWTMPAGTAGEGAAREALLDALVQRQAGAVTMPAWQDEPEVNAHVVDLYAYLSARAEGRQGPGRPQR
jgi:mono/diheme cytochrome c family protein